MPYFDTVHQDRQLANIETISHLQSAARAGILPQVAWVAPNGSNSERPACADFQGPGVHHWVDQQPDEGLGVELDHHLFGLGRLGRPLRPRDPTPGLVISPYAKKGYASVPMPTVAPWMNFR